MTTPTTHYGLTLYNNLSPDTDATFQKYRDDQSGIAVDSNMNIIDLALYAHDVAIANKINGFVYVASNATGTNTYEKTSVTPITAYYVGLGILLSVDTNNTGASTLDINSLGVIQLKKLSSGISINLNSGDLSTGILYPFIYFPDNTWVLLSGSGGGGGSVSTDIIAVQVFS